MANIKFNGIVIAEALYRDNDKMLKIISPELGIISCLSRGCKRPKSSLMHCSSVFVKGEFIVYQSKERNTLVSGSVEDMHYNLRLDPLKLSIASYIVQAIASAGVENEDCTQIYKLLDRSLELLSQEIKAPIKLLNIFIVHFLNHIGYKPRLVHCARCLKNINVQSNSKLFFSNEEGGIVCQDCAISEDSFISNKDYIELLNYVQNSKKNKLLEEDNHQQKRIFLLLNSFLEYQVQQKMKSFTLLISLI